MPFECPDCGRTLPNFMNSGYRNQCTACNPNHETVSSSSSSSDNSRSVDEEVDASSSVSAESHYYVEVTPPDHAPISTIAHVFAVDRYNQDDRQHDRYSQQLYQYAKKGEREHKEELVERLLECYRLRFAPEPIEFDIIVFPRSTQGKVCSELQDLARELASEFDVEYNQSLERTETVPSQKSQGRRGRWQNHEGTIAVTGDVRHQIIILFDDICTSGASLAWGTKELLEAGASKVICISLGLSYKQRNPVNEIEYSDVTIRDVL